MKRWRIPVLLLGLLVCLTLVPAQAAGPLSPDVKTDFTIHYQYETTNLGGATLYLYRVADRSDFSVFQPIAPFDSYLQAESRKDGAEVGVERLDLSTNTAWQGLANTLKGWVVSSSTEEKAEPIATLQTDADGNAAFPELTPGLYLVYADSLRSGRTTYTSEPTLIALPAMNYEENSWQTDVTCIPKTSKTVRNKPTGDKDPEPITKKVLKIWEDEGLEDQRPESVTVELLRDGEVYDTVELSVENNWRYSWDKLDADYEWMISEPQMENYIPLTDEEGITTTVTNYPTTDFEDEEPPLNEGPPPENPTETPPDVTIEIPEEPTPLNAAPGEEPPATTTNERLPQTGLLWWPVPVLVGAGIVCVLIGVVRRRGDDCA